MIEVSLTEIALFIWAVAATGAWLHSRDELRGTKMFVRAILEDEDIRNKVLAEHKKFMQGREA